MKNIYLIISSISLAVLISACDSKGSGDTTYESVNPSSPNTDTNTTLNIKVIQCNNSNNSDATNDCGSIGVDYFTCIKDADTLISDNDNTKLEIMDKVSGDRKVCVQNTTPQGSAHILRGI